MDGASQELRQVLSASPPGWRPPPGAVAVGGNPDPTAVLHASLEHLRNTGDERYLFLRTMLEVLSARGFLRCGDGAAVAATTPLSGEEEQLLFHCATGMRHVLLFRWEACRISFRRCLRELLLAIGLGIANDNGGGADGSTNGGGGGAPAITNGSARVFLPRTVAMACLGCASSLWKRGWGDEDGAAFEASGSDGQQAYLEALIADRLTPVMRRLDRDSAGGEARGELFGYLNSLLASPFERRSPTEPGMHKRRYSAAMAASFLSLLLGEFSGGDCSARYGLPIQFHRSRYEEFEDSGGAASGGDSGLDDTLRLAMTALSSLVGHVLNDDAAVGDESLLDLGCAIVDATCDTLSWEFGRGSSSRDFTSCRIRNGALLRPPKRWRQWLINPEFLGAMFHVYTAVRVGANGGGLPRGLLEKRGRMAHLLRQLLTQLSSVAAGPIFVDGGERDAYAGFLLDGCLNALESILNEQNQEQQAGQIQSDLLGAEVVDLVTMLSRLTTNFGVATVGGLPSFPRYLAALCATGTWLLESNLAEFQRAGGDMESVEDVEWRNEAVGQILQCSDTMAGDYWLAGGIGGEEAARTSRALASTLAPLYVPYCTCRVQASCLEEHFAAREGAELDEAREEISASGLGEEMTSAASLGRLNLVASMMTLSGMFGECLPRLLALFQCVGSGSGGGLSPEVAALLEEARMLVLCAGHLLTDDCEGETSAVPESVVAVCRADPSCVASIVGLVETLRSVAESQATAVASHPYDPRLSPLLAKTLVWFFRRWAPAYVLPHSYEYVEAGTVGGILGAYSTPDAARLIVEFSVTLCTVYYCHWPQEGEVHDESFFLLMALARKGATARRLMAESPHLGRLAGLHSASASLRHGATRAEVKAAAGIASVADVAGYVRLPYASRARVLTFLIVACSEIKHGVSVAMLEGCLRAAEAPFSALVRALGNKHGISKDINVQESACLSISLYGGMVLASEMLEPERIPHFITPYLPRLSGLMDFYAEDLTICECLLKLFRDYAERYIAMLTRDQCLELLTASASLLKRYSEYHCKNRVIRKRLSEAVEDEFEEEKNYSDVLTLTQLLIHLGTKDFTDLCNAQVGPSKRVETSQITDVIFFGLQQILPLMTQGLLQYPTLCQHYFSLVGFMSETYPEKLCALSFSLFNSLLDSLLFGMSHSDPLVSKSSLQGLASLAREHLKTRALLTHFSTKGDIIEICTSRLMLEVVFQPVIWDRLEPAGMALLPLAAIDIQKFINLVNTISQQLGSDDKQRRLHGAFGQLIKPDVLSNVAAEGREGRVVRVQFKKDFDMFVRDVHSFLIMK